MYSTHSYTLETMSLSRLLVQSSNLSSRSLVNLSNKSSIEIGAESAGVSVLSFDAGDLGGGFLSLRS